MIYTIWLLDLDMQDDDDDSRRTVLYKIPRYNMSVDMMANRGPVYIFGRKGAGKSWLVRDILRHQTRRFDLGVVMCPDQVNDFYAGFMPSSFIHEGYDDEVVASLCERQYRLGSQCHSVFLVCDDAIYDQTNFTNAAGFGRMINNYFHYDISFMMTCQWPIVIPSNMTGDFGHLFVFPDDQKCNYESLYQQYFSKVESLSFGVFAKIMDFLRDDHRCLVLKYCHIDGVGVYDMYWYKVEDSSQDFKLCAQKYWKKTRKRIRKRIRKRV